MISDPSVEIEPGLSWLPGEHGISWNRNRELLETVVIPHRSSPFKYFFG